MRYIVICKDKTVFYSDWFEKETHWNDWIFCVIDDYLEMITYDGNLWKQIERDHL